tara:strand:+ start:4073 stop:4741 length:669 start_codon:yes stop_codon:yes gene_type:complete
MKTIRFFILSFVLGAASPALQAQITVGLKTGYTQAWEDYGDVNLPDDAIIHVNRFNVTTMGYYRLTPHFSLGIEPGFVKRGAACVPGWWGDTPGFSGDTQLTLNYVEMPLMLAANVPFWSQKLEFKAKLGYGLAYMVSANEKRVDLETNEELFKGKVDFDRRNLNRWDNGVYLGIGFGYQIGKGSLLLESTYFRSPKNADESNASKNRSVNINLGYAFLLSR